MTMQQSFKMKSDRFRKVRGGTAKLLSVCCSKCGSHLLVYQKDGVGKLKRCYLDRIHAPPDLESLQRNPNVRVPRDLPPLACRQCGTLVGTPMIHHSGRLAFRLWPGAIEKKRLS